MDALASFQTKVILVDMVLVAKAPAIGHWLGCPKCLVD